MNMSDIEEPFRKFIAGFNIDRFGVGRHIIRDDRGWRLHDVAVDLLWLCSIQPSFDPNAYLMMVHTKEKIQGSLFFEDSGGLSIKEDMPVELVDFSDPVIGAIEENGLNVSKGGVSLDGISYSLHIRGWGCDLDLKFSNPSTDSLQRIESLLLSCGEKVVSTINKDYLNEYIEIWKKYVG